MQLKVTDFGHYLCAECCLFASKKKKNYTHLFVGCNGSAFELNSVGGSAKKSCGKINWAFCKQFIWYNNQITAKKKRRKKEKESKNNDKKKKQPKA